MKVSTVATGYTEPSVLEVLVRYKVNLLYNIMNQLVIWAKVVVPARITIVCNIKI